MLLFNGMGIEHNQFLVAIHSVTPAPDFRMFSPYAR